MLRMMKKLENLLSDNGEISIDKEQSDLDKATEKQEKMDISSTTHEIDSTKIEPDPETDLPCRAWHRMKVSQVFKKAKPLDIRTDIHPDHIRFVCISDTHSKIKADIKEFYIPHGDVLLHAGDFTMKGGPLEIQNFNIFLGKLTHTKKIVIAGNHELSFDENREDDCCFETSIGSLKSYLHSKGVKSAKDLITNAVYLQDSMVTLCGINIYGSPWQPRNFDWAFTAERGAEILQKWDLIPESVDVLITHGPPVGHGDVTKAGINVGCVELLKTVQKRVKPKFHVFGHIHEGYGSTTDGVTTFINASSCTKGYRLVNPPIIFDMPLPPGQSKERLLDELEIVSFSSEMTAPKSKTVKLSKEDREKKANMLLELRKAKSRPKID